MERTYRIGTPGKPWGEAEKQQWFDERTIERSYRDEVLAKLDALKADASTVGFGLSQYGSLPIDSERYPLMAVTVRSPNAQAPWVLITGGVHGYETSGVQGALRFLETTAASYSERVNMVVAPCVSPWGYEVINRWNPNAVDPNRSFRDGGGSEEATQLMAMVQKVKNSGVDFIMHMDLHETTDTDESEFRPAVAARDGEPFVPGTIPDGFYTVGDTANPQPDFQAAIIAGVEPVTHIAPADEKGQLIGSDMVQRGVINYDLRNWGLCAGITNAPLTSTTEVYPDSPKATDAICIDAQVAAVTAGLDHALHSDLTVARTRTRDDSLRLGDDPAATL